ncbi:hypothetical protein J6590_066787 [Homalodisca vitripennis]|nr:hypothetical protein J6590_066787 [Homalodisca vitripennis]
MSQRSESQQRYQCVLPLLYIAWTSNKPKVTCSDCKTDFHAVCLKFSKADVDCITQDGMVWRCKNCAAERRKSMRFESEAGEGRLSLEDVMKVVTEIRDSQKQYEKSFNTAIEAVNLQLAENTDAVKAQSNECSKMSNLIEALTTENSQLKKKVKELETRLEDIEQYSRSNCIEIQGIPLEPAENVLNIVKDVGRALDFDISDTMVDACHRLGVQKTGDKPPGIIVKFVRRMDKESFIQRRRVKTTLSTPESISCIDHVFTKITNKYMTEAEVMVVDTNITDHRMVVLSVRVCANRTDRQIDTSPASSGPSYRIDYVKLKTTLDSVDWKDVYSDTNPSSAFYTFHSKLLSIISECKVEKRNARESLVKIKPWMNNYICAKIKFKNKLFEKVKNHPNNDKLINYF